MLATMRPARRENGRLWIHTVPGPLSVREEHALAAEDHRLHRAGADDVELDRRGHRRDAAGVDVQFLARRQIALHDAAADVDEGVAVALAASA